MIGNFPAHNMKTAPEAKRPEPFCLLLLAILRRTAAATAAAECI